MLRSNPLLSTEHIFNTWEAHAVALVTDLVRNLEKSIQKRELMQKGHEFEASLEYIANSRAA